MQDKQKYFYIRVTPEIHRQTKTQAAMQGISVQEYISSILLKDLQQAKITNE